MEDLKTFFLSKFRPLTVVLPIEKIMKEAIRMVPEFIYDSASPDTSHFRSGRGCHSALRRIKEEWGTSRWFFEFDIRKCFHTIDQDRLISILKEEIDDSKFFYSTQKLFSSGRSHMRVNRVTVANRGLTVLQALVRFQLATLDYSIHAFLRGAQRHIPKCSKFCTLGV